MTSKNHILEEIRRTAQENGGSPLGMSRFAKETGIRKSEWYGRYWARWGDALVEAGYEPNELQVAYPDDYLLESIARLTRKLGHFPVDGEIRLEARSVKSFPDATTFSRFAGKQELLDRVARYCAERTEFQDVAEICASAVKPSQAPKARSTVDEPEYGFVYLIRSGRFYKIGKTNSLGRRERELAIQLPEKVRLEHSIKTDDPVGIEEYWHKRFRDRRKNGEWFELEPGDVAAFRRRKFM